MEFERALITEKNIDMGWEGFYLFRMNSPGELCHPFLYIIFKFSAVSKIYSIRGFPDAACSYICRIRPFLGTPTRDVFVFCRSVVAFHVLCLLVNNSHPCSSLYMDLEFIFLLETKSYWMIVSSLSSISFIIGIIGQRNPDGFVVVRIFCLVL